VSHPDSESELTKRALLPAGLRDVLPLDAAHEAAVIEALMARCASHGYDRVKPPLVEFETSLFAGPGGAIDRKSTRLNSSHITISYAVFCLKKKKEYTNYFGRETIRRSYYRRDT